MTAHQQQQPEEQLVGPDNLPEYKRILLAADASDHSNQGAKEAVTIAQAYAGYVTGAHVYAAKMHDLRFRQMEGGLPEQYKKETELEKQRDIHDDLITRGLSVITDSYLDGVAESCKSGGVDYYRKSLEGKNYRELVNETNSGEYDLLIVGSQGLGAINPALIGTVTERVVRRTLTDTLIVKNPEHSVFSGPIVAAVDGSEQAYAGLLTAFNLAKKTGCKVHVISAFDPYYHYVAFNRIADVLSEEAGKVFKFKEQEELHENIIDSGLAKIYDGHLVVARDLAEKAGIEITSKLLDGKAHDAIEKYVAEVNASLLVIGKTGIHADAELDIGGNAELLLRQVTCGLLITTQKFKPELEVLAEATTSWTHEAEAKLAKVPSFVRAMAKTAILRHAQAEGHTVVTESIVAEATKDLCPVQLDSSDESIADIKASMEIQWSVEATEVLAAVRDANIRDNIRLRAEKKARQEQSSSVLAEHVKAFLVKNSNTQAAIQTTAQTTEQIADQPKQEKGKCPFDAGNQESSEQEPWSPSLRWNDGAWTRLNAIPRGFMRELTAKRIEEWAHQHQYLEVTVEVMEEKYDSWEQGSQDIKKSMDWDAKAWQRIERIPDFVKPMVILEAERKAQANNQPIVTTETLSGAMGNWAESGEFHSKPSAEG